ncbi:MAG: WecB/TagA/CpsF family glycosyltransferase, partial [Candidatus Moraniibacteriota bacterium]
LVTRNSDDTPQLPVAGYQLLFSNFRAPHQEFFIAKFKDKVSELRIGIGVGGAFDFLTGKRKRAPKWLRAIGLEWLWRVIQQPSRIRRIWNAVIVFPVRVFWK